MIGQAVLACVVALPPVLALLVVLPGRTGRTGHWLAPWSSLMLMIPVIHPERYTYQWPLEGLVLGADEISRPLLLLTAIAWTLAGLMARSLILEQRQSFWLGWLLSLAGMSLVLLAGNLIAFYLGYAVLSLSAFLLVVHARSRQAWRAGRVYLVLALAGEAAILAGVLMIGARLGNVELAGLSLAPAGGIHPAAGWLLLAGFAVKLGILPLHVWLPLAHPVAPVPASAILSGIIVKAGLAGWLRLVPPDAPGLAEGATALIGLGLVTAFGGVLLGLFQERLKTVLAYSTISQMGLVLTAFALVFVLPDDRARIAAAAGIIALHHGLNKASLFLACGCAPGLARARLALMALPALSIAALPLSTGYLAKELIKHEVYAAGLAGPLTTVLALTSTATALLMWKALCLAARHRQPDAGAHPAWIALTVLALVVPWWWTWIEGMLPEITAAGLWAASWPLLLAAGLVAGWIALARLGPHRPPRWQLPEGDLVVLPEALVLAIGRGVRIPNRPTVPKRWPRAAMRRLTVVARATESHLGLLPLAGLIMLLLAAGLWWLLQAAA